MFNQTALPHQPTQMEVLFSELYNPHFAARDRRRARRQIELEKNRNYADARLECHYFCGQELDAKEID